MRRASIISGFCILTILLEAQVSHKPDPLVDITHYEFNLDINDTTNNIDGTTIIDIHFRGVVPDVVLDLKNTNESGKGMKVSSVMYNDSAARWEHKDNLLKVNSGINGTAGDSCRIVIKYSGIPSDGLIISKNKFGNRTFFSDHWPDRASCYLPVVDHPSDKARVDFIITAPSHYEVVGSGHLVEESDLPGGLRITHWKEDIPLPVKVMAFAAASFAVQLAGSVDNIPVWTWVFPENRKEGFYDYSVAVKPLTFYENLIGPYPYEKLANVQSKTIFGGLENAGCIFYGENSVTGQGKAENLIAHEVAHQWFGNSVTEGDWRHIWLSEGFATYLTSVYIEKTYGKEKFAGSMKSARERVLKAYVKKPGAVIDTSVINLMNLLNDYTYQKGAWILQMLRNKIGDEQFWQGMRLYYKQFRDGNAITDDFIRVMEEVSHMELKEFFHQWLFVPGQPDLKIGAEPGRQKGSVDIVVEQTQDYIYTFDLELRVKDSRGSSTVKIPVSQKITRTRVKAGPDFEITVDPDTKLFFRQIRN